MTTHREVIQNRVEISPEAPLLKGFHPGGEIIDVLHGELEYKIEGEPTRTVKAGEALIVPALIVYDGWASLKLLDVVAIIVGPVLAMFIAHVFAGALAAYAARGRHFSKRELPNTVGAELGWL